MLVSVAEFTPYGSPIAVALVDSKYTAPEAGRHMLARLQPYLPTLPIMLISIEPNGFRTHATFQHLTLLALLQLELLFFATLDLSHPPVPADRSLPF